MQFIDNELKAIFVVIKKTKSYFLIEIETHEI